MPEYLFADRGGKIVSYEYDEVLPFSADQVLSSLESVFNMFPFPVHVEQIEDYDVFHVSFLEKNNDIGEIFICAKGTTPGGRNNLKDEQRIQPKAKYLNYVFERGNEGKKAIFLGVYNRDGEIILCTWKVKESEAASHETPISKQIKITSIAKAMQEGFVQQDKGKGEYACAFRPEFLYFYLRNSDWLHSGHTSEISKYAIPENFDGPVGIINEEYSEKVNFYTGIMNKHSRNRIIFGAPGTGKSFTLNKDKNELLANGGEYERVTFHPDYSYANFVGAYKPVMVTGDSKPRNNAEKEVLSILSDESKNAQEKYDLLYDILKDENLTRIPILLGLCTDEQFKTRKQDGSDAVGDNTVERNHGKAIRPYVSLLSDKQEKGEIAYEYVPGPFMRVLVKALRSAMSDEPKPYLLIIEEINRANTAAVFGDVFQLLDRKDNISEYPIQTSEDMRKYLAKELHVFEDECAEIRIPDNMFIWATMNSADQGVYPMDTAFKRRWDFEYIDINYGAEKIPERSFVCNDKTVKWDDIRKAINYALEHKYELNEDKLLGPFFISMNVLENADDKLFWDTFDNKVLMYLCDDALRHRNGEHLFKDMKAEKLSYAKVHRLFKEKGLDIFTEKIIEAAKIQDIKTNSAELENEV